MGKEEVLDDSFSSEQSNDSKIEKECVYCHSVPYQIISMTCDHNFCLDCAFYKIPNEKGNLPSLFVCNICKKATILSKNLRLTLSNIFEDRKTKKDDDRDRQGTVQSEVEKDRNSATKMIQSLDDMRNSRKLLKKKIREEEEKRGLQREEEEQIVPINFIEAESGINAEESQKRLATIFETIELTSEFQSKINNDQSDVRREEQTVSRESQKEVSGFIEVSILEKRSLMSNMSEGESVMANKSSVNKYNVESTGSQRKNVKQPVKPSSSRNSNKRNPQVFLQREMTKKQSFTEFLKNKKQKGKAGTLKKEKLAKHLLITKKLRAVTEPSEEEPSGFKYSRFIFKTSEENMQTCAIHDAPVQLIQDNKKLCLKCVNMVRKKEKKEISQLHIKEEAVKEVKVQIDTKTNLLSNLKKEGEILKNNVMQRLSISNEKYLRFCEDMIIFFTTEKAKHQENSLQLQQEIEKEFQNNCINLRSKTLYCDKLSQSLEKIDPKDDKFFDKLKTIKTNFEMKFRRNTKTRTNFYDFFKQKLDKTFNYYKERLTGLTKEVNQKMQVFSFYLFSDKIVPSLLNPKKLKTNSFLDIPDIKNHLKQINKIIKQLQDKNCKSKLYKSSDKATSRKISNPLKKGKKDWDRKSLDSKLKNNKKLNKPKRRVEEIKKQLNVKNFGFNNISLNRFKSFGKFVKVKKN